MVAVTLLAATVLAALGLTATLRADEPARIGEGATVAVVEGERVTYGEYVRYGRTLLGPDGKNLSVTPEELLDQMVSRTLIVQEARRRHLLPRRDPVAAGRMTAMRDPRLRESIESREGLDQYVANLEVFDLYTQLRTQVVGSVALTGAEKAALPATPDAANRRIAQERAVREKADRAWLRWLSGLRARAEVVKEPAPAWR